MVVIVDTCSLHRLVEYYMPLDKAGKLIPLFKDQFMHEKAIMTESVYQECSFISKGIILTRMPFLKSKEFHRLIVKKDELIPEKKLLNIANEQFVIKSKINSLKPEEQEEQKTRFLNGADFSLLACAYKKNKDISDVLFRDNVRVLTDESTSDNDNKCFHKIPKCCKILEIDTINIREYLEYVTDGRIELLIR